MRYVVGSPDLKDNFEKEREVKEKRGIKYGRGEGGKNRYTDDWERQRREEKYK